jgi:NitT/TauT family transport system substrate-binding protein
VSFDYSFETDGIVLIAALERPFAILSGGQVALARTQDIPVNVLPVSDYMDMAANGIITNEETIAENPELVQGFVRAVLRGLEDTLADPDAAYEISKRYVERLDNGRKPVLTASLDLWQARHPRHD